MNDEQILRKQIRNQNFATPLCNTLGIRMVNIDGINNAINRLANDGHCVREFRSYVSDLLLLQLSELLRLLDYRKDISQVIKVEIAKTKNYLWPDK